MDEYQELAALEALEFAVKGRLKRAKKMAAKRAAREGTLKHAVEIGGRTVAVYTVPVSRGPKVTDRRKVDEWLEASALGEWAYEVDLGALGPGGYDDLLWWLAEHHPQAVSKRFKPAKDWKSWVSQGPGGACKTSDGELVPGCEWREEPLAARLVQPGRENRKMDPGLVLSALGARDVMEALGVEPPPLPPAPQSVEVECIEETEE